MTDIALIIFIFQEFYRKPYDDLSFIFLIGWRKSNSKNHGRETG
jgi:hypothetical protein